MLVIILALKAERSAVACYLSPFSSSSFTYFRDLGVDKSRQSFPYLYHLNILILEYRALKKLDSFFVLESGGYCF